MSMMWSEMKAVLWPDTIPLHLAVIVGNAPSSSEVLNQGKVPLVASRGVLARFARTHVLQPMNPAFVFWSFLPRTSCRYKANLGSPRSGNVCAGRPRREQVSFRRLPYWSLVKKWPHFPLDTCGTQVWSFLQNCRKPANAFIISHLQTCLSLLATHPSPRLQAHTSLPHLFRLRRQPQL